MNGPLMREKRKELGLTQDALSEKAQIAQSVLSELECGARQTASIRTVKRLAEALGISLDDLLADPTPAEPAA